MSTSSPDDPLIPVPIPPLVMILHLKERDKGAPLTEAEVLAVRGSCVCMMMRRSDAALLAKRRGYDDIDPEHAWEQWQAICESLPQPPNSPG
jgi:hypothetical protein